MKNVTKTLRILCALIALMMFPGLTALAEASAAETAPGALSVTVPVTEDAKFNTAYLELSPDAFLAAGFKLGDSCDILFSNGFALTDVPCYNGYYVQDNDPLVIVYPGSARVKIGFNYGTLWDDAGLKDGDTVTVTLREAGKYLDTQEALGQDYSADITEYDTFEQFCNFRPMSGGKLKEGLFFRGASPVDNSRSRASHVDDLLEKHGIAFIVDLADNLANIAQYYSGEFFDSPYTTRIYEDGNMILLDLGAAYMSDAFCQSVAAGLREMTGAEGPVYIHCLEGKDRTGFVCMLLESLAGASYDEMLADYMKTYENYYGITKENAPGKYAAIQKLYFDGFCAFLLGVKDPDTLKAADYTGAAEKYLQHGGMTAEEVTTLKEMITA